MSKKILAQVEKLQKSFQKAALQLEGLWILASACQDKSHAEPLKVKRKKRKSKMTKQ